MSYSANWDNGSAQGRVEPAVHTICLSDAEEVATAVNRRRLLIYKWDQDFSSHVQSGAWVRESTISSETTPPFDSFRINITDKILSPPAGVLGGNPATPAAMDWLWPVSGPDENKILVAGDAGVGEGEVGLLQKLNGTAHWTNSTLTPGGTYVRAVHINELRQAIEWIRRGRWRLPVYLPAGIFSAMPDTPWMGQAVANNGTVELRSLGYAIITPSGTPTRGLVNVAVRSSSSLSITADRECTVEAHHCLRSLLWASDPPTWNEYRPGGNKGWATPGATGQGDSTFIGTVQLQTDAPGSISNSALVSALQNMIDGGKDNFLLRRTDTGPSTANISAEVTIEFELDPDG